MYLLKALFAILFAASLTIAGVIAPNQDSKKCMLSKSKEGVKLRFPKTPLYDYAKLYCVSLSDEKSSIAVKPAALLSEENKQSIMGYGDPYPGTQYMPMIRMFLWNSAPENTAPWSLSVDECYTLLHGLLDACSDSDHEGYTTGGTTLANPKTGEEELFRYRGAIVYLGVLGDSAEPVTRAVGYMILGLDVK
ncbi:hypothetical protein EX30DRAFT_53644 [Ascodesmis nigricans]|uniref:Ecp2 effector protein domain-containing protein n=1 Tax=Ascodesmis nigricans TaxID=341454 RepID=A0A4S2MVE4_9PEZI|nr:hypothetical protein EX30DRAFT_53644 [Ascodesmis nigricans]